MEDDGTTRATERRKPLIRGGQAAGPKPARPGTPPVRNTFVSEIGRPLFEGVDLDSHLERFVLDAVEGEFPEPCVPVTPPPAPKAASRPPPMKIRPPTPRPRGAMGLLPELEPSGPMSTAPVPAPAAAPAAQPAPLAAGAPPAAVKAQQHAERAEPVEPPIASTADIGPFIEDSLREEPEPAPVTLHPTSEAGAMTVDALPPGAPLRPDAGKEPAVYATLLGHLRRVPRDVWETGAAALLGGVIGYQASSLLMSLLR